MRKIILLFLIFVFANCVYAYDRVYYGYPNSRAIKRPVYNPYLNSYKNPYFYKKYNSNNQKRIQRLNRIRQINRLKNNFLSWDFVNRNNNLNNGIMTGYSVPITSDVYNQINQNSFNLDDKIPNTNCNTELFSTPSGAEIYYGDGRYYKNFNQTSGKTGVRIIYD